MALSNEQYAFFVLLSASGGFLVFILQRFKSFSCGRCKIGLNSARNNQPLEIPAILQTPQQHANANDDLENQPPPPPPPLPQEVLQEVIIPLASEIIRRLSHDRS
jgi:hypothetical protein